MGLRYKKAHVTHPELKVTVQLPIISVKKVSFQLSALCPPLLPRNYKLIAPRQNPQNPMYTQLGVLTKGTIIEVNGMSAFPTSSFYPLSIVQFRYQSISLHLPPRTAPLSLPLSVVSELGIVTTGGKVVWGRWAQVTVSGPLSRKS